LETAPTDRFRVLDDSLASDFNPLNLGHDPIVARELVASPLLWEVRTAKSASWNPTAGGPQYPHARRTTF